MSVPARNDEPLPLEPATKDGQKKCSRCRHYKVTTNFGKNRSAPDGLSYWCNECRASDRRSNREQRRNYHKQWRDQNLLHSREWMRRWYQTPAGKEKRKRESVAARRRRDEWRRRFPERNAEIAARYNARKRGATIERVDYLSIRKRDNDICHICGTVVTNETLSFDHVVPLSKGGSHSNANVRVAHRSCNSRKKDRLWPKT